ncbi:hypothetical protein AS189_11910 [Arthrobacter alpinus]|uniref:Putative zinc-finger domain-containing protein n=1 Tax=Arthrobacter alpinus TaxID=656366 RepID=A0A0S2M0E0_9MICC|nr:zf-HC2 domain-containing protein [Arthrobacter alpinus]ALO67073.1 hypothetical protein AS189_11910 [Arthrobacter alpinus]
METSDSYALWDAAYVLGSLPAAQRREFEQHLSTCSSCQRQVAALSGIPTLLARNGAENAEAFAVAPAVAGHVPLYAGLADQLARRRRRFTVALAAAAIIVAGTTAAITTGLNSSTAPPPSAVSSASSSVSLTFAGTSPQGLTATGTLSSYPWGTQISWRCRYAPAAQYAGDPAGQDYSLVMVSASGVETTVASWTAGPGSEVTPTASTGTPAQSIARLDIRDSGGATLLSAAP